MTTVFTRVLLMPSNDPDAITATIMVSWEDVPIAMTSRTPASNPRLTYSVRDVPKRRCRRGATNTEKISSSSPQPAKT